MSRRHRAEKREILPCQISGSGVAAERHHARWQKVHRREDRLRRAVRVDKAKTEAIRVFHDALENIKPSVGFALAVSVARPIRSPSKFARSVVRPWPFAGL